MIDLERMRMRFETLHTAVVEWIDPANVSHAFFGALEDASLKWGPELISEVERLQQQEKALRKLLADLNAKLDETHTHRCLYCEATVTEETAKRQARESLQ